MGEPKLRFKADDGSDFQIGKIRHLESCSIFPQVGILIRTIAWQSSPKIILIQFMPMHWLITEHMDMPIITKLTATHSL